MLAKMHFFRIFLDILFIYISTIIPFPSFPSAISHLILPPPVSVRVLTYPPSPASLPWLSPTQGHQGFKRPSCPPHFHYACQCHSLLHIQLEPQQKCKFKYNLNRLITYSYFAISRFSLSWFQCDFFFCNNVDSFLCYTWFVCLFDFFVCLLQSDNSLSVNRGTQHNCIRLY